METLDPKKVIAREWGVRWNGEPTVMIYGSEQAAKGLFKHYGVPGEQLVSRLITEWNVEDERKDESPSD
jgi:hypothetical protein